MAPKFRGGSDDFLDDEEFGRKGKGRPRKKSASALPVYDPLKLIWPAAPSLLVAGM